MIIMDTTTNKMVRNGHFSGSLKFCESTNVKLIMVEPHTYGPLLGYAYVTLIRPIAFGGNGHIGGLHACNAL